MASQSNKSMRDDCIRNVISELHFCQDSARQDWKPNVPINCMDAMMPKFNRCQFQYYIRNHNISK